MEKIQELLVASMQGLKDFQRATVASVMESFDGGAESNRVLVADEVGLGKTIIAKGVIATLLKRHIAEGADDDKRRPFRVTYICSNLTLADENREKLSIFDTTVRAHYVSEPSFSRLLEVARNEKERTKGKILEICTLTPTTSFSLTQGHGNVVERVIIYMALCDNVMLSKYCSKLRRIMQGDVSDSTWEKEVSYFEGYYTLNKKVVDNFHERLEHESAGYTDECAWLGLSGDSNYLVILQSLCSMNTNNTLLEENRIFIYRFRIKLRGVLARCCAGSLTADLFILDEFQRFKALLGTDDESEQALIAKEVFKNESGAKVLSLSATPFKAMTKVEDDEAGEAHAEDLLFLLNFLMDSDEHKLSLYESGRKGILEQLLSLRDSNKKVEELDAGAKLQVESVLSPFILRTERAQISKGYESVYEPKVTECIDNFSMSDIKSFVALSAIEEGLNKIQKGRYSRQVMEFCKSAPWPMSFLNGYQLFEQVKKNRGKNEIESALRRSDDVWLSKKAIDRYRLNLAKDAPNARMRALVDVVFGNGGDALLWIAPSLPYYQPAGPYKGTEGFTKSLLFSAWAMVPRALSGLLSYESERRNLSIRPGKKRGYFQPERNPIIRFEGDAGIDGWSLVYPSLTLSAIPLSPSSNTPHETKDLIRRNISNCLSRLEKYATGTERRSLWYAFAPILLDIEHGHNSYVRSWLDGQSVTTNAGVDASGRRKHLQLLERVFVSDTLELGPRPDDLLDFLCELTVAGPGVCATRAWRQRWDVDYAKLAIDAGRVGMAITHMFNKIDSISILEKYYSELRQHWRAALRYCLDGNLQAMIDEYSHLLADSGMASASASERYAQVCGITTSSVSCRYRDDKNRLATADESKDPYKLRCHYAVPLGTQRVTDDSGLERVVNVRDAFNSPFRPFVLNSTSIGQEGLDFHWYSSRVIHWNLPSNPIDIEQREGRVNRYKSLVVRRRLAENYSHMLSIGFEGDIWKHLFQLCDRVTKNSRVSDLEPYWHLSVGTAKIERVVPMMPMSREVKRLQEALKVLSLYRLAFGQPRQEELLRNLLHRNLSEDELIHLREKLVINLAPHMRRTRQC
ncbi:MAG: helicase-related protein [Syntrophales bacterium]